MARMTPEERSEFARKGARTRRETREASVLGHAYFDSIIFHNRSPIKGVDMDGKVTRDTIGVFGEQFHVERMYRRLREQLARVNER